MAQQHRACHFAAMSEQRFDLAVVGAGMNGSLLALAAGKAGLRTALIDRVPLGSMTEAGFDGRTTAISYTSQRLFEAVGVWDEVVDKAEPILDIRISDAGHDGRASPLFLHFDHREAARDGKEGNEPAAPMGWIVENRFLRASIMRRLAACAEVELIAPDELLETDRDPDKVEISLKSGRRLTARLVASAEGRFGTMREDAGIGARAWSYNQIAIVLVARHAAPHRGVAQEKFLPGGPFAILPMRDNEKGEHRSSIVWTERASLARRLLELDAPRFQAEFARRFGGFLGPVDTIGPRWSYPLGLVHAERYVGAAGAGGRRRARAASDRGPGLQSRCARYRGAGRGAGRRQAARPRYRRGGHARTLCALAAGLQFHHGRRDRSAEPAVLQRH